eukprot:11163222-Prorocentrum_lima.AAC.1
MTSSLVGSEMCIRDRCTRTRRSPRASPWPCKRKAAQDPSAGEPDHTEPVSYTHLTLPTICSV